MTKTNKYIVYADLYVDRVRTVKRVFEARSPKHALKLAEKSLCGSGNDIEPEGASVLAAWKGGEGWVRDKDQPSGKVSCAVELYEPERIHPGDEELHGL